MHGVVLYATCLGDRSLSFCMLEQRCSSGAPVYLSPRCPLLSTLEQLRPDEHVPVSVRHACGKENLISYAFTHYGLVVTQSSQSPQQTLAIEKRHVMPWHSLRCRETQTAAEKSKVWRSLCEMCASSAVLRHAAHANSKSNMPIH